MIEYKNKVLFLRKSKNGNHLFTFNRNGIIGEEVESLIMNISDIKRLIEGSTTWIKVSVMKKSNSAEREEDPETIII